MKILKNCDKRYSYFVLTWIVDGGEALYMAHPNAKFELTSDVNSAVGFDYLEQTRIQRDRLSHLGTPQIQVVDWNPTLHTWNL